MLMAFNWPVSFEQPAWLWLLLAIPAIAIVSRRSLAGLEPYRRVLAVVFRSAVVALLAMALARIQYVRRNENVAVVFVLDKSHSIPEDRRKAAEDYVRKAIGQAGRDDRVGVITFDGQADVDLIPSRGGDKGLGNSIGFGMTVQPDITNIAAGVRLALAALPEGYKRRIVVITDGNQNAGNLVEEVGAAVASGVAIDIVPLEYSHDREILLDRIVVPSQAGKETRLPVRIIAKSKRPTRARLTLYHNGQVVPLPQSEYDLDGDMRPTVIKTAVEVFGRPGSSDFGEWHSFDARLSPVDEGADEIVQNNRATAFTVVDEQSLVLILTREEEKADHDLLLSALKREKVNVVLKTVEDFVVDAVNLQNYSAVLLSNISAETFNGEQHKALAGYVRDSGGGLIMIGGNESFGAGGWIGKPVEEVSPVYFDIRQKKVMPRGALVIIMHSCESPQGNDYGEKAAIATVETLSSRDYLGVITFNPSVGGANWDVPLSLLADKAGVISRMRNLQIGDMPDFGSTMQMAVTGLLGLKDVSQRHMIIISDGDPQPPSSSIIQQMIKNKITASTIGIGYGGAHCIEQTLISIARQTSGDPRKFFRCTNPRTLPQIFVKEAKTIRRSLISEESFTPALAQYDIQTVQGVADGPMPKLGGLVLTEPKADIVMPLVRKNADGRDDPLLAYRHFEMGKMAVFTSGMWRKWGATWAEWDKFGKFWSQLIRWCMRQPPGHDFDVSTRIDGNVGRIVVEALKKDASYLNFLQIGGRLTLPNGDSRPLQLIQTGPGQYEGQFNVVDNGDYLINLIYTDPTDPERKHGVIRSGLSIPYSQEFRELQANMPLLERIVSRSGGRKLKMDPVNDRIYDPRGLPAAEMRQPAWRWVVTWLLIPIFLLDVAARRLASTLALSIYVELAVLAVMFGVLHAARASAWSYVGALVLAEVVGWSVRWRYIVPTIEFFTWSVTALARAGQRSAQSLSHLKGVREKVREDLRTEAEPPPEPRGIPLEPAADPTRRFEVDEETAARPAGDLTEALGGAVAVEQDESIKPARRPGRKPAGTDEVTSRLLKAKRRARDQMEDEKKEP